MTINFATSVPDVYGGLTPAEREPLYEVTLQTSNFTAIMEAYSSNTIMLMDHPACGDACSTRVTVSPGAALYSNE